MIRTLRIEEATALLTPGDFNRLASGWPLADVLYRVAEVNGARFVPQHADGTIPAKTARRRAKKLQQARALAREGEEP